MLVAPSDRTRTCAALAGAALALSGCTGQIGGEAAPGPADLPNDSPLTGGGPNPDSPGGPSSADPTTDNPKPGDPPGGPESPVAPVECAADAAPDVGATPLRRLTRLEYALTLQHLLQLPAPPDVTAVPAEAARDGFTVHSELQTLSAQHLRGYLEVASGLAEALLSDPARQTAVIGCELASQGCLDSFVSSFGRLAYRRPLSAEETTAIVTAASEQDFDAAEPFRFAIEALLVSPNFLYRSEFGAHPALEDTPQQLSAYEIASRLSFALLGRGPSAALLDQAEAGALQSEQGRAEVATQLAEEAAFPEFYRTFFEQWLDYDALVAPKVPPADWDDALLDDMQAETQAVVDQFAWTGANFLDVLSTDDTHVTPSLAAFYGLPAPQQAGWVSIPADHPRAGAGLLGHAALLSQKTDGDPVALRGNWLRGTFLCQHLEIPEEVAATFGERLVGLTRTQIVRERNTDAACANCHKLIDPIGVGLDAFGPTGRFDPDYVMPDYGIQPALPGGPEERFDDIAELSAQLKAMPEVAACLTERTFLFIRGSEPDARDRCALKHAQQAFIDSGYDFRVLIESLVTSPTFTLRRAPAAPDPGGAP